MKQTFELPNGIDECLKYLQEVFDGFKLKKAEKNRALLMAEESLTSISKHSKDSVLTVTVKRYIGKIKVCLMADGERFDPFEDASDVNAILMKSFSPDLKYVHTHTKNRITISAYKSRNLFLYRIIGAALLAGLLSLILRNVCSDETRTYLTNNVFAVMKDIYMNALTMMIAPLIFFSISSSIAGFGNAADIGRVGARIMGIYLMTTVICISIGFGLTFLLKPYDYAEAVQSTAADVSQYTTTQIDTSVKGFLMSIVPSNFFEPFVKNDTIPIMFLAFLVGLATLLAGEKTRPFATFLDSGNAVFMKIADVVMQLIPIMIFSYVCVTLVPPKSGLNSGSLKSMICAAVAFVLTIIIMLVVYNLLLWLMGGLNPFKLLKKYAPHALKVIVMGSSSAAIPINMQVCEELGVPSKIYSLSIPLGATINMDGISMYLAVFGLTFAKIYGIEITLPVLLSMAFTIIMLSAGAPTIYGVSLICLSVMLTSINVPVDEALGQAVGMEVIAGMFRTINNSIGDMVGTLITASKEGVLDLAKYNK
ncbi:MAG: dicarboxylate/amino acid:cation symporter [Lachnospiraceae bacterium]|nr:dicarboxylate/amino acid:cation symporter [Lachnospiraceae bacterium]